MLVLTPLRESGKVLEYVARVGVKDVRAVTMNQHAGVILTIVRIAADVVSAVDQKYFAPEISRHLRSDYRSGKACAHDDVIKHAKPPTGAPLELWKFLRSCSVSIASRRKS